MKAVFLDTKLRHLGIVQTLIVIPIIIALIGMVQRAPKQAHFRFHDWANKKPATEWAGADFYT